MQEIHTLKIQIGKQEDSVIIVLTFGTSKCATTIGYLTL